MHIYKHCRVQCVVLVSEFLLILTSLEHSLNSRFANFNVCVIFSIFLNKSENKSLSWWILPNYVTGWRLPYDYLCPLKRILNFYINSQANLCKNLNWIVSVFHWTAKFFTKTPCMLRLPDFQTCRHLCYCDSSDCV